MAAGWIEKVTGSFDDKKRWRAYKARKEQLPPAYRTGRCFSNQAIIRSRISGRYSWRVLRQTTLWKFSGLP